MRPHISAVSEHRKVSIGRASEFSVEQRISGRLIARSLAKTVG